MPALRVQIPQVDQESQEILRRKYNKGSKQIEDTMVVMATKIQKYVRRWKLEALRKRRDREVERANHNSQFDAAQQKFNELMIGKYGNLARAWRDGIDGLGQGKVNHSQFMRVCKDLHVKHEAAEVLFRGYDENERGHITHREFDPRSYYAIEGLRTRILDTFESYSDAWTTSFSKTK